MSDRQTIIKGPLDQVFDNIQLGPNASDGCPIIADLVEEHGISFSKRNSSGLFDPAVPGVTCNPGTMVVVVPQHIAEHIRKMKLKAIERSKIGAFGSGQVDSANLPKGTTH